MPEDTRTDEALAEACRDGDNSALVPLVHRYETPLWACALKLSHYKDKPFIDDITQIVFWTIFKLLKSGRFTPRYPGSFKAWAFTMCRKITMAENRSRNRRAKPITEEYLESFSEDATPRRINSSIQTCADEKYLSRLNEAMERLTPLDRKLCQLRNQGIPYEKILKHPDFCTNKSGQLRMKYCRILERLRRYLEEKK